MTAPEVVSGWPDDATIERAAELVRDADYRHECAESVQMGNPATYWTDLARAEAARALVADIERRFSPNGEIRSSEALTGLRAALAAEGDRR